MSKKNILGSILIVMAVVFVCGIYFTYRNYRYGEELYNSVNKMSIQASTLANSIEFLENEMESATNQEDTIDANGFYSAIASTQSGFGYEDMPILDEVRMQYIDYFDALYAQTVNDSNHVKLTQWYTTAAETGEIAALKGQLNLMLEQFQTFNEKNNKMTVLEKCFISWKNEQIILTENLKWDALPSLAEQKTTDDSVYTNGLCVKPGK